MKKKFGVRHLIFYVFFCVCSSLYALGEKTLVIGGGMGWDAVTTRQGVAEAPAVRPVPVMALVSGGRSPGAGMELDLSLSFDEGRPELFADRTGHYSVTADPSVSTVTQRRARAGAGAIRFTGNASQDVLAIMPRSSQALFSPGQRLKDFSLEFWLSGENMENGEQVLYWSSTRLSIGGSHTVQRIQAAVSRNRLQWTFQDFFIDPQDQRRISLSFSGITPLTPQTWSHHSIRFDSNTGSLEYLVNGQAESIVYATSSGREGGEVFTPIIGQGSKLVLGSRFAGMMDEFRLYGSFSGEPALQRYHRSGGRMETRFLDLGEGNSEVLRIDARGGCVSYPVGKTANSRERISSTSAFAGIGAFRFPNDSTINFSIRTSETPFPAAPDPAAWKPFEPGTELKNIRGRYVQIAADFYPSGEGESTPYLEELRIIYIPDEAPRPPSVITAVSRNGAVELSWNNSADKDTAGYLVYYGTSRGDFFGDDAILGVSPINVGKRNSVRIEGLSNGVLYYFAVSAYDRLAPVHGGEFSREVSVRPLRMIE